MEYFALSPDVLVLADRRIQISSLLRQAWPLVEARDQAWLLSDPEATSFPPRSEILRLWRATNRQASYVLRFCDLRFEAACRWQESGVHPACVASWLGRRGTSAERFNPVVEMAKHDAVARSFQALLSPSVPLTLH
jgi:hypothetical protein